MRWLGRESVFSVSGGRELKGIRGHGNCVAVADVERGGGDGDREGEFDWLGLRRG